MSAETLRRAAALMRERAEAATPGPWSIRHRQYVVTGSTPGSLVGCDEPADAEHIASWHPAVALAVADLLDMHAQGLEDFNGRLRFADKGAPYPEAEPNARFLAVARTYLGDPA